MYPGSTFGQYSTHIEHIEHLHIARVTLSMFYIALSQVSAASSTDKKQDAQAGCGKAATDIKVFWSRQCHICGQDFLECGGGQKNLLAPQVLLEEVRPESRPSTYGF